MLYIIRIKCMHTYSYTLGAFFTLMFDALLLLNEQWSPQERDWSATSPFFPSFYSGRSLHPQYDGSLQSWNQTRVASFPILHLLDYWISKLFKYLAIVWFFFKNVYSWNFLNKKLWYVEWWLVIIYMLYHTEVIVVRNFRNFRNFPTIFCIFWRG